MNSQNITNVSDISGATVTLTGGITIGSLNYGDSGAVVAADTKDGFYQGLLVQNKSAGGNASTNVVAVSNTEAYDYVAMGINSSTFTNAYNTLFEIPNASYISSTADMIVGGQSSHYVDVSASLYLTYKTGEGAYCINTQGALSFDASRPGGVLDKGNFGTPGQILYSDGASAPPLWADIPPTVSVITSLPETITPTRGQKGTVYVYNDVSGTLTVNTTQLAGVSAGWFIVIKNASTTGDITLAATPSALTGTTTVYGGSGTANGGVVYLYWTGTALVGY